MNIKTHIITYSFLLLTLTSYTAQHNMSELFVVKARSVEQIEKEMNDAQTALRILYIDPNIAQLLNRVDQLDEQSQQYTQLRAELLEKIRKLREADAHNDEIKALSDEYQKEFEQKEIPAEKQKREFITQWNLTQKQKDPTRTWGIFINGWQIIVNKEKILREINALKAQYWHAKTVISKEKPQSNMPAHDAPNKALQECQTKLNDQEKMCQNKLHDQEKDCNKKITIANTRIINTQNQSNAWKEKYEHSIAHRDKEKSNKTLPMNQRIQEMSNKVDDLERIMEETEKMKN